MEDDDAAEDADAVVEEADATSSPVVVVASCGNGGASESFSTFFWLSFCGVSLVSGILWVLLLVGGTENSCSAVGAGLDGCPSVTALSGSPSSCWW